MSKEKLQSHAVQTTGHAWDGDLQEYNNPLPRWWVWAFYLTIVFALVYWVLYPAWPLGKGYTTGIAKVTYVNSKGETVTTHWNTRADLMAEMNAAAKAQKPYYDKIAALPLEQIAKDPELNSFVISAGKQLFGDNCAACHQAGGQGVVGLFPNLTDDDWLYGGTLEKIQETITYGRRGFMPAFGSVFTPEQIDQLANYVLSLSGEKVDAVKAQAGNALFHSMDAMCFYCHGDDAKGRQDVGAPNLTDKIWLWAKVPAADTPEKKVEAVKTVITQGLGKGVMPAWKDRLKPEQIKLLAVYVHELGGGK
ncbi:cytochrome-c oxidase, cbb3-type subunit III [Thiobacter aerophilum]|uniref:Cbb3-type cytochrome c oxidase subunit n=1 Tax=Thiobacter aerophilum TaxID=3121275 RepID=A0ABV0EEA1_9BURK